MAINANLVNVNLNYKFDREGISESERANKYNENLKLIIENQRILYANIKEVRDNG